MELFLDKGVDPALKLKLYTYGSKVSILEYAKRRGNEKIVELIESRLAS